MKLSAKPPVVHLPLDTREIIAILRREITGHFQPDLPFWCSLSQQPVRFAKNVESFLGRDSRKVADYELFRIRPLFLFKTIKAYSKRHDVHFRFRNPK